MRSDLTYCDFLVLAPIDFEIEAVESELKKNGWKTSKRFDDDDFPDPIDGDIDSIFEMEMYRSIVPHFDILNLVPVYDTADPVATTTSSDYYYESGAAGGTCTKCNVASAVDSVCYTIKQVQYNEQTMNAGWKGNKMIEQKQQTKMHGIPNSI